MKTVFTNGCFDIIHSGHIYCLETAAMFGDRLIVGMNTDASIRRQKGPDRPVVDQNQRQAVIASLRVVDDVILFDEDTPGRLIEMIKPDVLVKGDDYGLGDTIGLDMMMASGAIAAWIPRTTLSTTRLIRRIRER